MGLAGLDQIGSVAHMVKLQNLVKCVLGTRLEVHICVT